MRKLIPLFFLICGFYSCTEVITVDLNSTSPKVVVDGAVSNRPGPDTIKLSMTTNYFAPAGNNALSGAKVFISDNTGHTDTLHEISPGNYLTSTTVGTIGNTYYLSIKANGQTYTASSTMPDTVSIDSMSYALRLPRFGSAGNPTYSITCSFTDPPALGNYYGFRLYRNGIRVGDIIDNRVINDKLINGNAQHIKFRNDALIFGDSVRVDLVCMDKAGFDFYNTLKSTLSAGSPFSAPPANPITNISNGGIGYFGAQSFRSKAIQLQN
jgi:hypothetical protein